MVGFFKPRKRKSKSSIDLTSESNSSNKIKCLEEKKILKKKNYSKRVSTKNSKKENIKDWLNNTKKKPRKGKKLIQHQALEWWFFYTLLLQLRAISNVWWLSFVDE